MLHLIKCKMATRTVSDLDIGGRDAVQQLLVGHLLAHPVEVLGRQREPAAGPACLSERHVMTETILLCR